MCWCKVCIAIVKKEIHTIHHFSNFCEPTCAKFSYFGASGYLLSMNLLSPMTCYGKMSLCQYLIWIPRHDFVKYYLSPLFYHFDDSQHFWPSGSELNLLVLSYMSLSLLVLHFADIESLRSFLHILQLQMLCPLWVILLHFLFMSTKLLVSKTHFGPYSLNPTRCLQSDPRLVHHPYRWLLYFCSSLTNLRNSLG